MLNEKIDTYLDQEKLHNFEGRRGVENLCQLVGAIGYKDPQSYGILRRGACLGDLMSFLEDNPGAIEAIVNFIGDVNSPDWEAALDEQIEGSDQE